MAAARDLLVEAGFPQRLDKWLYFARLAKSRTLAADLIVAGKVRVNRARAGKPSQPLRACSTMICRMAKNNYLHEAGGDA